jgi:hypothetical protein
MDAVSDPPGAGAEFDSGEPEEDVLPQARTAIRAATMAE